MNEPDMYREEEFKEGPKLSDGKRWAIFWLIIVFTHVPLTQLAMIVGGWWLMVPVAFGYGFYVPEIIGKWCFGYDAVREKVSSWFK